MSATTELLLEKINALKSEAESLGTSQSDRGTEIQNQILGLNKQLLAQQAALIESKNVLKG